MSGRGQNDRVMVRDNELLKWTGANSYRTWDPVDKRQLDEALKLGLSVTVGLRIGTDGGPSEFIR